ncbi:MAG: hypothetical protein ACREC0_07840 [Methylocella sp.]
MSSMMRGFAKFGKSVGFVASGVAIVFIVAVAGYILGDGGRTGRFVRWMGEPAILAVFGPTTRSQLMEAGILSDAQQLEARIWAVGVTIPLVILLWAMGREVLNRRLGDRRLWAVIISCVAMVGIGYYHYLSGNRIVALDLNLFETLTRFSK